MRYIYSFLLYLALPYLFLRLWWRSRRLPEYRERLGERLGYYPFTLKKCLWVHAVSVGETIAAIPLIKALKSRYPDLPIVVTTMTPTGAARVKAGLGESVTHVYIPYDYPGAVRRFLRAMHPVAGIIMETELWPNLLAACHQLRIPVCLANARLSEKSARGYRRIKPLTRDMLQKIDVIAAHGKADADRFIALGAPKDRVIVTGNLKFDLEVPRDLADKASVLREALGKERFIWIAASTHEGEEEIVLTAHKKIMKTNPQALLILVPRHPDRFDSAAALCQQQELTVARRSRQDPCTTKTAVYLGDTMGELLLMYAVSDAAFVGGSLIERGGHNILEPAALGRPVLSGPHMFNFAEITQLFSDGEAITKVFDAESLAAEIELLMQNSILRAQMGERALLIVAENRGALTKQVNLICSVLDQQKHVTVK